MKKLLSLLLTSVLIFALLAPAYAAGEKTAFVVVSGMNTFPLCYDNGEQAFPPTSDAITATVKKLLAPTAAYIADRDSDKLGKELMPAAYDLFAAIRCDENGNSVNSITTTVFDGPLTDCAEVFTAETEDELGIVHAGIEKFGVENTFFFNYDWRLDPLVHADRLNDFIKTVKNATGCNRVALAAFSMGGTVVCSYLYKYGSRDLKTLALCSTAFQGTASVGGLYTGDFTLSMDGLMRRLAQMTRDDTWENVVNGLALSLKRMGITGGLDGFANTLAWDLLDETYGDVIIPVFGYMPGLWALVNDADYEASKAFMLNEADNAKLISRIDEYHYNVQMKAKELLETAQKDTNIYITAQYNLQGLPISEKTNVSNNDFLIEACYASGGAICADLGTTLGDGYTQAVDCGHDHLSPDGQIDASTCMFPEQTWFIRDMIHVDYPCGGGSELIMEFMSSDIQLTTATSSYKQFLKYDYKTNTLSELTEKNSRSFGDKLFDVFAKILNKLFDILKSFLSALKNTIN